MSLATCPELLHFRVPAAVSSLALTMCQALTLDPDVRLDLRTAMLAVNDHSSFDDLSAHWPTLRETIANASDPVAIASAAVAQLVVDSDGLPPVLPPASSCEEAAPDATCSALGPANSAHRMQLCGACTGTAAEIPGSCFGTAETIPESPATCTGAATALEICANDTACGAVGMVSGAPHVVGCVPVATPVPVCEASFAAAPNDLSESCALGCEYAALVAERTPVCDLDNSTDGSAECPSGCHFRPPHTPACDLDAATDGIAACPAGCSSGGCVPHPPREGGARAAKAAVTGYAGRLHAVAGFLEMLRDGAAVQAGRLELESWLAALAELEGEPLFEYLPRERSVNKTENVLDCRTAECFSAHVEQWEGDWLGVLAMLAEPLRVFAYGPPPPPPSVSAAPEQEGGKTRGEFLVVLFSVVSFLCLMAIVGTVIAREELRLLAMLGLALCGPLCLVQAALLTPVLLVGSDACGGGPAALAGFAFADTHLGFSSRLEWSTDQQIVDALTKIYDVSALAPPPPMPRSPPDPRGVFGLPLGAPPVHFEVETGWANASGLTLSSPAMLLRSLLDGCAPASPQGLELPPLVGVDEMADALQTLARTAGAETVGAIRAKLEAVGGVQVPMQAHLDAIERHWTEDVPQSLGEGQTAFGCEALRADLDEMAEALCCDVLGAVRGLTVWMGLLGCLQCCGTGLLCCGSGHPEMMKGAPIGCEKRFADNKQNQALEEWRAALGGAIQPQKPGDGDGDDDDDY